MSEPYRRSAHHRQQDFQAARAFEEEVGRHLGPNVVARLDSTTDLDFWLPEVFIECKEKRQRLTERWRLLDGVDEKDLFILDELSLRKAIEKGPSVYFVLRDLPENRMFLARVDEVACSSFARRNRVGKGKLILNLKNFRQIESLDKIVPMTMHEQTTLPWRRSECLSQLEIGQI